MLNVTRSLPATRRPAVSWLLALPLIAGCSGASGPAIPNPANPLPQGAAIPRSAPALTDPSTGFVAEFRAVLDPATESLTIEPVARNGAAIGDTFSEVGLTPAFTGQFGTHFWAEAVRRNGTNVEVDFATRHPFTPDKRPDLGIFNMKLWVAPEIGGTSVAGITGTPGFVTNADGHGEMWNTTATNGVPGGAPVQPYVIINEDPTSAPFDFHAPAGWNVLFPGQSSIDTVSLDLTTVPAGPITLHLYLTADYGQSAVRATRQNPAYELPKFAGNAPWKVTVTELNNTLQEGNGGSTADFRLDIWDWKHGQSLGSDVTGAQVFAPSIQNAPVTPTLSGTGTDPTPLTGTFTLVNTAVATGGDYWGVVAVSDAATGVALKDDLVTPVTASYVTYQWFSINVSPIAAFPPTAVIERCLADPLSVGIEDTFDGSSSIAGTNPITTYEWDFDYQVGNFVVEGTGVQISHAFPASAVYTIALRADDGFGNSDIATLGVNVSGNPIWNTPARLTTNSEYENTNYESAKMLAAGPDGTVHLVYNRWIFQPPYNYIVYHYQLDPCTSTWSAPVEVYHGPDNNQIFRQSSCAMGADGILHAAFGYVDGFSWGFGHAQYSAGSWSTPAAITPATAPAGYWDLGQIATSGANEVGFMSITSVSQNCPGSPAPPDHVYFMEKTGATWSAPTDIGLADVVITISPGCGGWSWATHSGALSGTNSGEWVAVWESLVNPYMGSDVPLITKSRWNKTTGGAWGTQADLYTAGQDYDTMSMRRSPDGAVWMVCRHNGNSTSLGRYDGTAWSPGVVDVFTGGGGYPTHGLSFDADGRGIILNGSGSPGGPIQVKRFNQTAALASIPGLPTEQVVAAPGGNYRWGADAVAVGDGRFLASWVSDVYGPLVEGMEIETSLFD